jgi:hypothetical protein
MRLLGDRLYGLAVLIGGPRIPPRTPALVVREIRERLDYLQLHFDLAEPLPAAVSADEMRTIRAQLGEL